MHAENLRLDPAWTKLGLAQVGSSLQGFGSAVLVSVWLHFARLGHALPSPGKTYIPEPAKKKYVGPGSCLVRGSNRVRLSSFRLVIARARVGSGMIPPRPCLAKPRISGHSSLPRLQQIDIILVIGKRFQDNLMEFRAQSKAICSRNVMIPLTCCWSF